MTTIYPAEKAAIDNPRGHVWRRNDYDGEVDFMAHDYDKHNGPACINCGYGYCVWCNETGPDEECSRPALEGEFVAVVPEERRLR